MSKDPRSAAESTREVHKADSARSRGTKVPGYMRICLTPKGPVRLTPTEMQILSFIHKHEGRPLAKSQIAAALGRNETTVSRLLTQLRQYQIVESVPSYADNGAQLANAYRIITPGGANTCPPSH